MQYTTQQVINALYKAKGLRYLAAKLLGCDQRTVRRYINRYVSVRQASEEARAEVIDVAEAKLYEAINRGDPWAIALFLKTQGKDRGYTERHEVREVRELSDNELRDAIARRLGTDLGAAQRSRAARDADSDTLH